MVTEGVIIKTEMDDEQDYFCPIMLGTGHLKIDATLSYDNDLLLRQVQW